MRILNGQKQGLVNTIVSKMIADCTIINEDNDDELEKIALRSNGVCNSARFLPFTWTFKRVSAWHLVIWAPFSELKMVLFIAIKANVFYWYRAWSLQSSF